MNKKYFGIVLLILATVVVVYFGIRKPAVEPIVDERINSIISEVNNGGDVEVVSTTINKRELSLDNWQQYAGTESGLKDEVTFSHPSDWHNVGAVGGGQSASNYFNDKKINRDVAYLHTNNFGYYAFDTDKEYSNIINRESVTIDGWPGEIIYRSVIKPGENEKKEWWLLIPQVGKEKVFPDTYEIYGDTYSCADSPCPTKRSYDFYMEDVYTNSDEVFHQLIKSIDFSDAI